MKKLTLFLAVENSVASFLGAHAATPTDAAPFHLLIPNIIKSNFMTLEPSHIVPVPTHVNQFLPEVFAPTATGQQQAAESKSASATPARSPTPATLASMMGQFASSPALTLSLSQTPTVPWIEEEEKTIESTQTVHHLSR